MQLFFSSYRLWYVSDSLIVEHLERLLSQLPLHPVLHGLGRRSSVLAQVHGDTEKLLGRVSGKHLENKRSVKPFFMSLGRSKRQR